MGPNIRTFVIGSGFLTISIPPPIPHGIWIRRAGPVGWVPPTEMTPYHAPCEGSVIGGLGHYHWNPSGNGGNGVLERETR